MYTLSLTTLFRSSNDDRNERNGQRRFGSLCVGKISGRIGEERSREPTVGYACAPALLLLCSEDSRRSVLGNFHFRYDAGSGVTEQNNHGQVSCETLHCNSPH